MEQGSLAALRMDLPQQEGRDAAYPSAAARLRVVCSDLDAAAAQIGRLPSVPSELVLELEQVPGENPYEKQFAGGVRTIRVASGHPSVLDYLQALPAGKVEVMLNRDSAEWLRQHRNDILEHEERWLFSLQTFLTRSEVEDRGVEPSRALRPLSGARIRLLNLPVCILPGAVSVSEDEAISPEALPGRKGADLSEFADHFILHRYRVHSLRCEPCAARDRCPGMPVNHVRAFGFGMLRPFSASGAPLTNSRTQG
jgi:hypothetical protein